MVEERDLWLGGIKIEYSMGLLGHSDASVLIHAICGALLGAVNVRSIGYHFSDTSDGTLSIDNKVASQKTMTLVATKGYQFGNVDITVCVEQPRINPHIPAMKSCLTRLIQTDEDNISIKTVTSERTGLVGRQEGMAAYAAVLIVKA